MSDTGFVSFQIRLRDVAFTTSRPTLDEVREDLNKLGLTNLEIEQVFDKTKNLLLTEEVVTRAGEKGVDNAKKGLGGRPMREEGPLCGHGVPTLKKTHNGKDWYTCQAKNARGDFLWKSKEGCEWVEVTN